MSVDHYENFPVASVLCPPALRPTVVALYHYARTADDLADEGPATPAERRVRLQHYRQNLEEVLAGGDPHLTGWPGVFVPLQAALHRHTLPPQPLRDLLSAFERDTDNPRYTTRGELLTYCALSANPVGRLLLHLYGVKDEQSLAQSDAICTALQLINFWQDFSRDHPNGRCYIPRDDALRHGVMDDPVTLTDTPATQALVADLAQWARGLMHQGQALALRVPGRAGWELRLVVQGGLRILDKIQALNHRTMTQRPRLSAFDTPLLLWRAARMKALSTP